MNESHPGHKTVCKDGVSVNICGKESAAARDHNLLGCGAGEGKYPGEKPKPLLRLSLVDARMGFAQSENVEIFFKK